MKILIVNDTRNENHHGCSRVMNCIDRNLMTRGFLDIDYIPLLFQWSVYEDTKKKIMQSDLLIINGEGTVHGDADHVNMLLNIIPFARSYNVPVIIINATIFNLKSKNLEKLLYANMIYVRDKESSNYLTKYDIISRYCPDLTFWKTNETYNDVERKKIGITEGFNFKPNLNIIKKNKFNQISVFNTKQAFYSYSFIRRFVESTIVHKVFFKKNKNIISIENHIKFLQLLNEFKFIITGRYHVVCFCLYLRIPFKYVNSNTPKITSLLNDVGLDIGKFRLTEDYNTIEYSLNEIKLIDSFLAKSSKSIDAMFDYILDLKHYA